MGGIEKQIHLSKKIVAIEMSGSCPKNESLVWNALLLCVNLYVSTSKAQKTPILIMLCVDFWELALVCVHIIYDLYFWECSNVHSILCQHKSFPSFQAEQDSEQN